MERRHNEERRQGDERREPDDTTPRNGMRLTLLMWLVSLVLSATVSYFVTIATVQKDAAVIKATEESHFAEVLRRLELMQADIRELRDRR